VCLEDIYEVNLYPTENVVLSYENKPVAAGYGNSRCLLPDSHETHKNTVWEEGRLFVFQLKHVVYKAAILVRGTGASS
jgi:hypothetical protein